VHYSGKTEKGGNNILFLFAALLVVKFSDFSKKMKESKTFLIRLCFLKSIKSNIFWVPSAESYPS